MARQITDANLPSGKPRPARSRAACLVIVPALNEELTIAGVVQGARSHLPTADILVIDDGSRDATAAEARRAGAIVLSLPYNLGIGGAVQTGFKFAHRWGYDYVIRLDGDGQHNPQDLSSLLDSVQHREVDVAIGSRFQRPGLYPDGFPKRSKGPDPVPPAGPQAIATTRPRRLGSWGFAWLVSALTRQPVSDTTSGLQCLNRRAIACLAADYAQDYPEVEGRIILHRAGLQVLEVPVVMLPRANGRSSITHFRAIYYVAKVLLATLMAVIRESPYAGRHLNAA